MYILNTGRLIYAAAKNTGRILKEIAIIFAQLLISLIFLAASKARSYVKPAIIQLVRWLKEKTIVFVTTAKPKVIEAGHMSKGLLIVAIGKVTTTKGVQTERKSALGEITNSEEDYETSLKQQQITTDTRANKISAEIILEQEKTMNLNETLAKEISQNGVGCKAIDRDSLPIEKGPYYSHLFPMSPRIITNRGCIRLERNGTRNIDIIQIIQKN